MRLLEKTDTRKIYDILKESYDCETYEQAAQEACEELFDSMTDDIFLNSVNTKEEDNVVKVTFNVSAYGGEPDENGNIEMNRDATIEVPLDYTESGENMTVNKFYEDFSELLKQWIIDHHDGPDSFYEGVMINTGSTTVTSDETGVTVEDNGNTITTGNGVTVDIDNENDVLPDEMDIAEPTEELPIDEPTEELPEEPTEELPEEPVEELPEEPTEDEEDLDESAVNEEVLEKKTDETEEEVNNSKIEEAVYVDDKAHDLPVGDNPDISSLHRELAKKYNNLKFKVEDTEAGYQKFTIRGPKEEIEGYLRDTGEEDNISMITEADGYNQNQNVEIYQNPEFDYQILDITELDNTDTGDVRAIDMANILNDLDESLTEAIGTNNWGEINSFLTRKGTHKKTNESYSSAILELTLPRLNESIGEYKNVFMLEVYGNGPIKECVVRDSKSHIIKEYSGKSKDPVKHFEGVIFDIMNSRRLNEEVVPMVNEPMKDKGVNFADSKAIDKDEERQEKHLKQHDARNKETKKFKIEKEPDQENTTGKTEEELTDTTEVEALPKAKKTKVDAKKLKVKEIKESYSIDELKDLIERLIDEAREYPENNPGSLYSQVIRELRDSGINNLADYLSGCYDRSDSSYIRGSHVIEDLKYALSKLNDMNESVKFNHINDVWEALEDCSNIDEINNVIKEIPNKFGSFTVEDCGDHVVVTNTYEEYGDVQEDKEDFYFESAKLNEADDELLDEPIVTDGTEPSDELEEGSSNVATFHRKPASVDAMRAAEQNGITVNKSNYKIVGTKELSNDEFNDFANHLSSKDYDWLQEYNDTSESGEFKCVEVINLDDDSYSILVDPQGYNYARYAAIKDNTDEEELLEPEEEELLEPESNEVE